MKSIKINNKVNTDAGIVLPAGCIAVISEGYTANKDMGENGIPAQVGILVYASLATYQAKKTPIVGITDFNTLIKGNLSEKNFSTATAEDLLIGTAFEYLNSIYPGKVEIIEITPQ
jgi:hypothetical protein